MALIRLELTSKPVGGGRQFGEVGAYEALTGEAEFALDPWHASNRNVVDLELAPRGGDGRVLVSSDVRILRPVDGGRGNGGLFLEVPNRGASIFVRMTEPGPLGAGTELSAGWLLQRGYTVVSCGWQHDVPRGEGRFGLTAPHAKLNGQPISGTVTTTRQIEAPTQLIDLCEGTAPHLGYPAADLNEPGATLKVRDHPSGPGTVIPRQSWRFARLDSGEPVADANYVLYPAGFTAGKTYEVSYTTAGAPITGAGFAALRDLASFLRFAPDKATNPCAGQLDFALAMGASQTGRFLRQMLHLGMCEDEDGRLVLDGILAIAAGARMTEANWRFGQPGAQGPTSAVFPFTDAVQTDPVSRRTDGLLRRALGHAHVPKVMHINTSSEYWSSAAITHVSAALSHVTPDGTTDVELPANVRMYHCASTQHAPSPLPLVAGGVAAYYPNTVDYKPFVRGAIENLYAWVRWGTPPPPSKHPRLDDGTLVDRDVVRAREPDLPGPGLPPTVFCAQRSGTSGFDACASEPGTSFSAPDLVPALDADGNELAGVRHPDVAVPLATYTGWNPRRATGTGAGTPLLLRVTGATIPFARTSQEREAHGDTRPSLQERYAGLSRHAYLERVRAAAVALVEQRYLLASDSDDLVHASAQRYDEFMRLESPTP